MHALVLVNRDAEPVVLVHSSFGQGTKAAQSGQSGPSSTAPVPSLNGFLEADPARTRGDETPFIAPEITSGPEDGHASHWGIGGRFDTIDYVGKLCCDAALEKADGIHSNFFAANWRSFFHRDHPVSHGWGYLGVESRRVPHDQLGALHRSRILPAERPLSHAKTPSEASLRVLPAALLALAVFGVSRVARAATYYVAPTGGSDSAAGAGTMTLPFATVGRAQTAAVAGDTVIIRGGTFAFSGSGTVGVAFSKSGTAAQPINYFAFPGESPIFDLDNLTPSNRVTGLDVHCSFVHLTGSTVRGVHQFMERPGFVGRAHPG